MRSRTLAAVAVAAVLAPAVGHADGREWEEDYDEGPAYRSDYDVSVDTGVSGGVTFDTFQGGLSPYGDWVVAGNYGRVWRPRVAAGWRPYYYGRWEWTNEGWMWVSDEPWGWAAYHYGRWAYDPYYAWVWVPGYEWAPAWVSWRFSGDVVGWAPLAPGLSVYGSAYPFVDYWWTFVPCNRFVSYPVYSVAYAPAYARQYFYATAPAPARPTPRFAPGRPAPAPSMAAPAWGGPAPRVIAERTGRPVVPARIVSAPQPGMRGRPGEIPVFRPEAGAGRGFPGRGPGPVAAPGAGGSPGRWAPGQGGVAPGGSQGRWAPGQGGAPGVAPGRTAPPQSYGPPAASPGRSGWQGPVRGGGRPEQTAPPPGWSGRGQAAPPAAQGGPPPAWRGGAPAQPHAPATAPAPARGSGGRGGDGHQRGGRD